MIRGHQVQAAACVLAAIAALAAALATPALAAPADVGALEPRDGRIYFGVSDTGDMAHFGQFSDAVNKHPAVIQSFRPWGSDFPDSIERWQTARARPMLHITTADGDGSEIIAPRAIAEGGGDRYLVRLNKLFWSKDMRAYIRPLGEPNRCLNLYAAYDCAGAARDAAHSTRAYKRAFRRIYVIVHGGGRKGEIDRRLAEAGLPPLQVGVRALPAAPVAVVWSPLPAGSPTVPHNRPRHFYPGSRWVDWVGTDFYASYPEWKALTGLYNRFRGKPFALTEWGVEAGDDPDFVRGLFDWIGKRPRCKMLVYYQDFGTTSSYRIQNFPASLAVLKARLHSPRFRFPPFAPGAPRLPPPPPGGIGTPAP